MFTATLVVGALLLAPPAADKPKLLVLDLNVAGGVGTDVAQAVSESIAQEVSRAGFFSPLSSSDVRTILGVERQRQMMGCSEGESCQAELAGALGARFALSGTLARLGESFQLTLQMIDTQKAQPVGRGSRIARAVDALNTQLPWLLSDVTGTPPPPQPTHLKPYAFIGGGALLLASGAVFGAVTNLESNTLQTQLSLGEHSPAVLNDYDFYAQADRRLSLQKDVALGAIVAGAALIGAGIYFYRGEAGGELSLLPTTSGAALAGVFP